MSQPNAATVVSLHQPHYFPWLGLVAKIAASDIFIVLDDVQFEKRGWQNRTRYSTPDGLKFLTVPVLQKGLYEQERQIRDVEINEPAGVAKHWRTLLHRYGKSPGWPRVADRLEAILTAKHERLISLCEATTQLTLDVFQVRPKTVRSSEFAVDSRKTDRVVELLGKVGATHYLSGTGAKAYLDPAAFDRANIALLFQDFSHPVYRQSTGRPFEPAAMALEWYFEEPEQAIDAFHASIGSGGGLPPRSG